MGVVGGRVVVIGGGVSVTRVQGDGLSEVDVGEGLVDVGVSPDTGVGSLVGMQVGIGVLVGVDVAVVAVGVPCEFAI